MQTYKEAEQFLFERLPMFQRVGGAAYKKDLSNTLKLLDRLGNPHRRGKYIHVAGTNGKGSTASMLASVMMESGYKVGLYTSPHLKHFSERIRINGVAISEEEILKYVKSYLPLIEEVQPSFFELTTAMAFEYFTDQQVDIAVMEVGLGGRLDSTNVITPEVAIITQIGLDHQQFLGDTKEEITKEKSGIIKNGVPVVTSVEENNLRNIIQEIAQSKNAIYHYSADEFELTQTDSDKDFIYFKVAAATGNNFELTSDLKGSYQKQNIKSVLSAAKILKEKGYAISEASLQAGLKKSRINSGMLGRWQEVANPINGARIIADGGHNSSAIAHIVQMLEKETCDQLHIIIGTVNDKSIDSMLELLPNTAKYYFTQAQIPRALNSNELKLKAAEFELYGESFETVDQAFSSAIMHSSENDLIFVGGSIFVIAEIPSL
jgi:dihydrofolate synthase/folylpolyglutamate synthase